MPEQNFIRNLFIFSSFPPEKQMEISNFSSIREFDVEDVIFEEGNTKNNIYGIIDGEVELRIKFRDKIFKTVSGFEEAIQTKIKTVEQDVVVEVIRSGEIFGWSSVLKQNVLTSTAKCFKPSRIVITPAEKLKTMLNNDPEMGYTFMEGLCEIVSHRLKNRTDRLIESWRKSFKTDMED